MKLKVMRNFVFNSFNLDIVIIELPLVCFVFNSFNLDIVIIELPLVCVYVCVCVCLCVCVAKFSNDFRGLNQ